MRHVTHMNGSCYTDKRVISHTWKRHANDSTLYCSACTDHVTHMNGTSCKYQWGMSHTWQIHIWCSNRCHDAYVTFHVWMSRVTQIHEICYPRTCVWPYMSCAMHMNEHKLCHTYEGVMSDIPLVTAPQPAHAYMWLSLVLSNIWTSHM